jgi:hypothetical protein
MVGGIYNVYTTFPAKQLLGTFCGRWMYDLSWLLGRHMDKTGWSVSATIYV